MSPVAESLTNIFGLGSQLSRVNNWRIPKLFSSSSAREAGVFLQSGLRAGLHSTTGGSLSSTVTVKAQEAVFPEGSQAAKVLVVERLVGKWRVGGVCSATVTMVGHVAVARPSLTVKLTTCSPSGNVFVKLMTPRVGRPLAGMEPDSSSVPSMLIV